MEHHLSDGNIRREGQQGEAAKREALKGMKIAVLDTTRARNIQWNRGRDIAEEIPASDRLLELLEDGYTVWIASTRPELSPDTHDKCLFDLIPKERFFTANPEMKTGCANAPALIDLWERVLAQFDIPIPEDTSEWGRSWMDLRAFASTYGIVTY